MKYNDNNEKNDEDNDDNDVSNADMNTRNYRPLRLANIGIILYVAISSFWLKVYSIPTLSQATYRTHTYMIQ